METKKSPIWKKTLSKGAFVVACIVIAVILLVVAVLITLRVRRGCVRSGASTAAPTATPEPTPLPDRVYSADRHPDVAPPAEALDIPADRAEELGDELSDLNYWIDLTPENAEGFRVVRNWKVGCSYVVENGKYYRLGEGEDGKGVVDVLLTDLDLDDVPDLLYTYHYGSNEDTVSKVGWFRFDTHESVLSDFAQKDGFFSLIEEDGRYILCRAVRDADLDTGTFGLTVTERLGEVSESMGRIVLVLDPKPTPETVQ